MAIADTDIERLRESVSIVDSIQGYVQLRRVGRNWVGLCPFHAEKSGSFNVREETRRYKCFGCGKSGNTITFLMEHDKLSYVEALRWLANRFNIEIEETEQTQEQKQFVQTADSLYIINNFSQQFFVFQLRACLQRYPIL